MKSLFKNSCLSLLTIMYIGCGGGGNDNKKPQSEEKFKKYNVSVIDDAVVGAKVEAVGCKEAKELGKGKYQLECSTPPKYISAKGGFVDIGDKNISMGLPLLLNLDKNLFDVNLSNIAVTPLSTLVANAKNKNELKKLAIKLGIRTDDFTKDISKSNKELFQKLNALLVVADNSGITNQLLLMKKLREQISKSEKKGIGNILKDALNKLKNDSELKKAYGELFISGFIDESETFMDKKDVLKELSNEYASTDKDTILITGFIYDAIIANAKIVILDGDTEVGSVKSLENGRWKIAIKKSILEDDKILLFTGTAIDNNGDKILLKSAITTKELREIAKKRISIADSIDLVISNVTTAQVALLEKNDKDFAKKADELEANKNKIEIFQQETLLKASAAIKSVIDGDSKISSDEDTYSFVFDNLVFEDDSQDKIELNLDGKISEEELNKQSDKIKEDAILSQQLLNIESKKALSPILEKSLYTVEVEKRGSSIIKKYKKLIVSNSKLIEKSYKLEDNRWKEIDSREYSGKIQNNVFYYDYDTNSTTPYAITLKEQTIVHSTELNKDYNFDILGKQLYLPYKDYDTTKVDLTIYSESFDAIVAFKELEDSKIIEALGKEYLNNTKEEQQLIVNRYLIDKISEKPKPFDRSKTKLNSAISILENMDTENDDVDAKLTEAKNILNSAEAKDKDAQVGKALFELAEITNSQTVGKLIDLEADGRTVELNNHLSTLIEDKSELEVKLLENISDLSETSMELIHETVLKLQDVNTTLGINFANEDYTFKYKDFNLTGNQAKLLRVAILSTASKLEYLTAFNYVTLDDVKTRTTTMNGVSAEYRNIDADPLSVFKRSDVGALNQTIGAERLAHSKELLLEALDVLNSVRATKEDKDIQQDIIDAQKEIDAIKSSLKNSTLYKIEDDEDDKLTVVYHVDLSALYSTSTALDLTHTLGHDLEYEADEHYYSHSTNKEYKVGSYNAEFSKFYNTAMAKEWIAEDGSKLTYVDDGSMRKPRLDTEYKTLPTGSNSHIPSIIKKIEIKESGKPTITHTGDNVLKYIFNDLDIEGDYHSSYITYYVEDDRHNTIPDSTVRYGAKILYGNVELIDADPVHGEVTVKVKDGYSGEQHFELEITDTLGHREVIHDYLYIN